MLHLDRRTIASLAVAFAVLVACMQATAQGDAQPEAFNMRLVGYSDLQARTAYQPTIQKQGTRWIAYVGHHGDKKPNPAIEKFSNPTVAPCRTTGEGAGASP